ncbi:VanZ family protein [Streptomyces sp. NPDC127084]|uniref:VanZ family protein n=1 Tax=Streptomyces sp. NPDC127084 TaxID=3347133 RepID=UPI003646E957
MIGAILNGNPWIVPAFLITGILASAAAVYLASRYERPKALSIFFGLSVSGEITATLYPSHIGVGASGVCTVNKDLLGPLATQQGLMNVALFIPVVFFATLLLRRPAVCLAGGVLLSGATELVQAVTAHIGRSCTSEDLVANSIGAVIGAFAAAVVGRLRPYNGLQPAGQQADLTLGVKIGAAGGAVIFLVASLVVTPVVAGSELVTAGSTDKETAERVVHQVFGSQSEITSVQTVAGQHGQPDQTLVSLKDGTLAFTAGAEFITGSTLATSLPGVTNKPLKRDADATTQATAFVRSRFPWALRGSKAVARPASAGSAQRIVAWRAYVDGVLMPMRMDVIVERDGRISSFTGRNESAPATPPAHPVTLEQARKAAERHLQGQSEFKEAQMLMQKNAQGVWETRWAVNFLLSSTEGNGGEAPAGPSPVTVLVNAKTGEVIGSPG